MRCKSDVCDISLLIGMAGIRSRANGWFTLTRKFTFKGKSPTNHFCTDRKASECMTTLSLTVFTQRNFVADSSSEVLCYTENGRFAFLSPFRDSGATYDVHHRLTGKCVVDFLLVLFELFSLGVTAEALRANIDWKSSCQKTRMNDLARRIKMWAQVSFILSQSTHLTDRQTYRRTDKKGLAIAWTAVAR